MSTIFAPASEPVVERMNDALRQYFPTLLDEDLRIEVLMGWKPAGGPAIRHHGAPALATISIVKGEERATGGPDLRIRVDKVRYEELRPRRQEAMFAHELYHIVMSKTRKGVTRRDAYDRPVVKFRPDDWSITGFKEVADWYGEDSIERMSYRRLGEALSQSTFEFFSHDDEAETVPLDSPRRSRKKGGAA